jgi:hypothetical protein
VFAGIRWLTDAIVGGGVVVPVDMLTGLRRGTHREVVRGGDYSKGVCRGLWYSV